LIAQSDPIKHRHQRKPWIHAFSSTAMKEYEEIIANRIKQLLGYFENTVHRSARKEGAELDIASWLNYFT
jgi:cytochrome P450